MGHFACMFDDYLYKGICIGILSLMSNIRIFLTRLCVMSNYPLKIIHSFDLVNTFYDLFRHIYMSLDSLVSHMKRTPHLKLFLFILGFGVQNPQKMKTFPLSNEHLQKHFNRSKIAPNHPSKV